MSDDSITTRRTFLASTGVIAGIALAGCSGGGSGGGSGGENDDGGGSNGDSSGGTESFDGWMENVGNYDGVVDKTGASKVTVTVGAKGNDGNFAFEPPAIRISTDTTVVWKWNGKGGTHNVHAMEGADFKSELTDKEGFTFEHTFAESGTVKYQCDPHASLGMKGVVGVE